MENVGYSTGMMAVEWMGSAVIGVEPHLLGLYKLPLRVHATSSLPQKTGYAQDLKQPPSLHHPVRTLKHIRTPLLLTPQLALLL
ncbi:hypothetical protein BDQ17DRAFT_1422451 [Cyathus striatus]|nr:hypothetical protein BDQ17DRAFT_1422451 [Cyathus striatus]